LSNKPPVNIRNNVESYSDPYIDDESPVENTVCRHCGSIFTAGRWYFKGDLTKDKMPTGPKHETLCPACQKLRDHVPSGILKLTGRFVDEHRDEILNLVRNESHKALGDNPLERVMSLESIVNGIQITTTNEKLAQRIGKAVHKAYSGDIEYKWSEDNKQARINWVREY